MSNHLSVQKAARKLGITLDAVYRLCKAGKLESKKRRNGQWQIPVAAIRERKTRKARELRRRKQKKAA